PGALGVAATVPDAPAIAPVLAALSRRFAGPFSTSGAVASGTAAAIAEVWVGAARGVQDAVFFAVDDHTTGGIVRGGAPMIGPRGPRRRGRPGDARARRHHGDSRRPAARSAAY